MYGGIDIDNIIDVLQANAGVVDSVLLYCGHGVETGLTVEPSTAALCLDSKLPDRLRDIGVEPELVLDPGSRDVEDYRAFLANSTANIAEMVRIGQAWGVKGWSLDLEPQSGSSPWSTTADADLYAGFLAEARSALHAAGMRLTAAVGERTPMLKDYATLAPSVDRLFDMATFRADSFEGWLQGDDCGGYDCGGNYSGFLSGAGAVAAPGFRCYDNPFCGRHICWTNRPESGPPRFAQLEQDGVQELAMYSLVQVDSLEKFPQDWYWPLLKAFKEGATQFV